MKQPQYSPLSIAQMAVSLFAANEGYLDDVPDNKVVDFEAALHSYMGSNQKALSDQINASADYNDEIAKSLHDAIKDFKANHTW
jgi:F-type H+-transporting ATPase subunit alpha